MQKEHLKELLFYLGAWSFDFSKRYSATAPTSMLIGSSIARLSLIPKDFSMIFDKGGLNSSGDRDGFS
jgi:hypothetical protein